MYKRQEVQCSSAIPTISKDELLAQLLATVRERMRDPSIEANTPLMDAGIDSIEAPRLVQHLQQATGLKLMQTLVFDGGTAQGIVRLAAIEFRLCASPSLVY